MENLKNESSSQGLSSRRREATGRGESLTTTLKSRIMRRIYAIWFARTLWHSIMLKLVLIAVLAFELKHLISLKAATMNMLQTGGLDRMLGYIAYALSHTYASVQLTFVLMIFLAGWSLLDALRKDFVMPMQMLAIR